MSGDLDGRTIASTDVTQEAMIGDDGTLETAVTTTLTFTDGTSVSFRDVTFEDAPDVECPVDGDSGYPGGEPGLWLCSSCGRELRA